MWPNIYEGNPSNHEKKRSNSKAPQSHREKKEEPDIAGE
jgi:hypothetical protein